MRQLCWAMRAWRAVREEAAPRDLGDHLLGLHALSGTSLFAIAGRRAHGGSPPDVACKSGAKGQMRRAWLRARAGEAAAWLQGVDLGLA